MNATDWDRKFETWKQPSGTDEATKCENAERIIRNAISRSAALNKRDIRVAAHGSYRNNTNVRQNSDVDIYVCCYDTFFHDFSHAQDFDKDTVGITPAIYLYPQFKSELQDALLAAFGPSGVTPGNKAFDVHANTYRVDADVVACFEYRRYTTGNKYNGFKYDSGIKFFSASNEEVINWPEQNHSNGTTKNNATNYFYKYVTRIIKRLRYEMADSNISAASAIPSYLVECMVYHLPNTSFQHPTYYNDVRDVLATLYHALKPGGEADEAFVEVNERKYLFSWTQPWTRTQAFNFVSATWNYIGFE